MRRRTIPPVRPNAGSRDLYSRALICLVDEMCRSVNRWLSAEWRKAPPIMSRDELPADRLRREVARLARTWEKRFADAAPRLAEHYSKKAEKRSSKHLEQILRDGGFSVKFKQTRAMSDAMAATVNEQVGLIRSIPEKYFTDLEGAVMRSASAGRDLASLVEEIGDHVDLERIGRGRKPGESGRSLAARTARRAHFIALDQTNKATATMARVRHLEMGLEDAIWVHSHAGKEPRPTHVANDGKRFSIRDGWLDPAVGKRIWPGTEPNCRCVSRPVVEGFS